MEKSDYFSISSESPVLPGKKVKNEDKVTKIIQNLKINFSDGTQAEVRNITKKGANIFIKQLNSCTSYHKSEKNHTFTIAVYIPEAGYSLIKFLNLKMVSQFIYEKQGVNWQNQIDSDSETDSYSDDIEEPGDCKKFQNCENWENGQKSEDFEIFEEFEENDGEEEIEENEKIQENEDEKKENAELDFCCCKIEMI